MSATTTAPALARELAAIVGVDHVVELGAAEPAPSFSFSRSTESENAAYEVDGVMPHVVVSPATAEEVTAVVRLAASKQLVVAACGGGTHQSIGNIPDRVDIALATTRLHALEHYDPGDLTLSAGAGLTFAALDAALAQHGQMLPLDVAVPQRASIGGLLATSAHGALRHHYGTARDYCVGLEFVTGDGVLAHAGGRVVKNVAGYDLMKLLIGSYGTLAVITRANFKVVPRPRQTATFISEFSDAAGALAFRDRIVQSPLQPLSLELVSPHAHEYFAPAPSPRDPDDWHPDAPTHARRHWSVLVRASGSDAVLARYRRELAATRELQGREEADLWRFAAAFGEEVLTRHRNAMLVQIGVLPSDVAPAIAAVEAAALDCSFMPAIIGRCALGALVAAFVPLAVDPPGAMSYAAAVSALRAALPPNAMATVLRCPREAKPHFDLWGSTPTDPASMRALKQALDPANILNRGRFLL